MTKVHQKTSIWLAILATTMVASECKAIEETQPASTDQRQPAPAALNQDQIAQRTNTIFQEVLRDNATLFGQLELTKADENAQRIDEISEEVSCPFTKLAYFDQADLIRLIVLSQQYDSKHRQDEVKFSERLKDAIDALLVAKDAADGEQENQQKKRDVLVNTANVIDDIILAINKCLPDKLDELIEELNKYDRWTKVHEMLKDKLKVYDENNEETAASEANSILDLLDEIEAQKPDDISDGKIPVRDNTEFELLSEKLRLVQEKKTDSNRDAPEAANTFAIDGGNTHYSLLLTEQIALAKWAQEFLFNQSMDRAVNFSNKLKGAITQRTDVLDIRFINDLHLKFASIKDRIVSITGFQFPESVPTADTAPNFTQFIGLVEQAGQQLSGRQQDVPEMNPQGQPPAGPITDLSEGTNNERNLATAGAHLRFSTDILPQIQGSNGTQTQQSTQPGPGRPTAPNTTSGANDGSLNRNNPQQVSPNNQREGSDNSTQASAGQKSGLTSRNNKRTTGSARKRGKGKRITKGRSGRAAKRKIVRGRVRIKGRNQRVKNQKRRIKGKRTKRTVR